MKAKEGIVCPRCGALNRPTWEFCARCNEPLEGAGTAAGTQAQAVVVTEAESRPSSFPAAAVVALTVLGAAGLAVAAWRYVSTTPPPGRPDPAVFTLGKRLAERPVPTAPPATTSAPGESEYNEGRHLLQLGDVAGAIAQLEAAVAADPANAEFHNAYGHALWRSDDKDGALAQYAEAARLDPRLQMQYARTLEVAGHSTEAQQEYEALLVKNPDAAMVHQDLGRLLFRSGDYTKAAAHLEQALSGRPDDLVLQQELAYSLDHAGDRRKAESTYREVLRVAPGASYTRVLLAESLAEQGRRPEALSLIQDGLRRSPNVPLLQRQLASVLERSGQPTEAAAAYRAYARLAPNAPDARAMADRAARLEASGRPQ